MARNSFLFALCLIVWFLGFSPGRALAQSEQPEQKGKAQPGAAEKSWDVVVKESKPKADQPKGKYIVGEPIKIEALGAGLRGFVLSICSGPAAQPDCHPLNQVPTIGTPFFLKAKGESDEPITISVRVLTGKVDCDTYDARAAGVRIDPKSAGKLVLEASATFKPGIPPRAPSIMTLFVSSGTGSEVSTCARLFPPVVERPPVIEASTIVKLIGVPQPYLLEALTKDTILIYSTQPPPGNADKIRKGILEDINRKIHLLSKFRPADLGVPPAKPFSVDLYVPHAAALGRVSDLAAQASNIDPKLKITSVTGDNIRITADDKPSCEAWVSFLSDLRRLVWKADSQPLISRLFYQDAREVAKALNGQAAAAGAPPPRTTALALGQDFMVFDEHSSGDSVSEKKRILAQLDLPRPEMIVNAWVMQNSSKDPKVITEFSDIVQWTVRSFNNQLEKSVAVGWGYLKQEKDRPDFFEESFHDYIARRYVGELKYGQIPSSVNQGAQEVLNLRSDLTLSDDERNRLQACGPNEYCLGYNSVFNPLKPRLTDLLITVISARDPRVQTERAIAAMEQHNQTDCQGDATHSDYCRKMLSHLRLSESDLSSGSASLQDCRVRDRAEIYRAARYGSAPPLFLQCFKEKAIGIFSDALANDPNPSRRSQLGLLRGAIADFLFHYKMSQQYPHEFLPYELSQSADTLNTALAPFIEGFNQDIEAYQDFLKAELRYRVDLLPRGRHWHILPESSSFINNGTVSVRTISGTLTGVNSTTQSLLDASKAPLLSDLVTNITSEDPNATNGTPTGILGNLSFNQAQLLMGVLKSYQSSTVQIGRQLSLDFTPRSLSTASSAEIEVTLKATETAPPTYFGGTKAGQSADLSRIANHETKTKIRIDSIKLFEVSSFSAELRKSRSQFPLLPPFVELPYVGTLFGIPLPPAKIYHTSTAVMSAIVVPTASDLAWGLAFIQDRILDANCDRCIGNDRTPNSELEIRRVRPAISLKDLGDRPVRAFHRRKFLCFATNPTPAGAGNQSPCAKQTFDEVLHEPL